MTHSRWLALSLAMVFSQAAQAALPQTLNYQGRMRLTSGAAVADSATHSASFALYSQLSGGTALWSENHSGNVATKDGLFNVVLGSINPITLPFDQKYWLGVNFNGDGEMAPRSELTMAPYAFRAAFADNAAVAAPLSLTLTTAMPLAPIHGVNLGAGPGVLGQASGTGPGVFGNSANAGGAGVLAQNMAGGHALVAAGSAQIVAGVTGLGSVLFVSQTTGANGGSGIHAVNAASATAAVVGQSLDTTVPGPGTEAGRGVHGHGPVGVLGTTNLVDGIGVVGSVNTNVGGGAIFGINDGTGAGVSGESGLGIGVNGWGLTGTAGRAGHPLGLGLLASSSGFPQARALLVDGPAYFANGSTSFTAHVDFSGALVTGLAGGLTPPVSWTAAAAFPGGVLTATNTGGGYGLSGYATQPGVDLAGPMPFDHPVTAGVHGYSSVSMSGGVLGRSASLNPASAGVLGLALTGTGVMGKSFGIDGQGASFEAPTGTGVRAQGVTGVAAESSWLPIFARNSLGGGFLPAILAEASGTGVGVIGRNTGNNAQGALGGAVDALNFVGGVGVQGVASDFMPAPGVQGRSLQGPGVEGRGATGVAAYTTATAGVALLGDYNDQPDALGLQVKGPSQFDSLTFTPGLANAGSGRLYFDAASNRFRVSEGGGPYVNLVGGGVTAPLSLTSTTTASTLYAQNTNAGAGHALFAQTSGIGAAALWANGSTYGVRATGNVGVYGVASTIGISGETNQSLGLAGSFINTAAAGEAVALRARSTDSLNGNAIHAQATGVGVSATASGANGVGVYASGQVALHADGPMHMKQLMAPPPGPPAGLGAMYYDGSTARFRAWNGASWVDLGALPNPLNLVYSGAGVTPVISGENNSGAGGSIGVQGRANSGFPTRFGLVGSTEAPTLPSTAAGVVGSTADPNGNGVFAFHTGVGNAQSAVSGFNNDGTNTGFGVRGSNSSPMGYGVYGRNIGGGGAMLAEGVTVGLSATASGASGVAVYGRANSGVAAIHGLNTGGGFSMGVLGESNGGLAGVVGSSSGGHGVAGLTDGTVARRAGVRGDGGAGTALQFGVYGFVPAGSHASSAGVIGNFGGAPELSGLLGGAGVMGLNNLPEGVGVYALTSGGNGTAMVATGESVGVSASAAIGGTGVFAFTKGTTGIAVNAQAPDTLGGAGFPAGAALRVEGAIKTSVNSYLEGAAIGNPWVVATTNTGPAGRVINNTGAGMVINTSAAAPTTIIVTNTLVNPGSVIIVNLNGITPVPSGQSYIVSALNGSFQLKFVAGAGAATNFTIPNGAGFNYFIIN